MMTTFLVAFSIVSCGLMIFFIQRYIRAYGIIRQLRIWVNEGKRRTAEEILHRESYRRVSISLYKDLEKSRIFYNEMHALVVSRDFQPNEKLIQLKMRMRAFMGEQPEDKLGKLNKNSG